MSILSLLGKMFTGAAPFIDTARDSCFSDASWFARMELKSNPGLILVLWITFTHFKENTGSNKHLLLLLSWQSEFNSSEMRNPLSKSQNKITEFLTHILLLLKLQFRIWPISRIDLSWLLTATIKLIDLPFFCFLKTHTP